MSSRFRTQFAFIIWWKCLYSMCQHASHVRWMCVMDVCIFALWCLIPLQIDNVDFWLINRLWLTHVCFEPWWVEKSTQKNGLLSFKMRENRDFTNKIICLRYNLQKILKIQIELNRAKKNVNQSLTKFSFFSPSLSTILYEWPISTMTTKWLR